LLENEERYRLLYQSAGIGVGYYTVDGKVISYNEIALQNMGGIKLPDVVGKSVYDLFPKENADVYFERITSTYNDNNSLEFVDEIDLPIGKRWFLSVFSCVKNVRGEVIGIQIMSVDISKQKQAEAEIKKSHERLEATNEKLQVVGGLTRHDVGNKLMAARSNLYLLRKKLKNDLELAKYLDGIENAFDQSNRIFEFSNLYEKIGSEEPYNMNVEDSFEEASKLIPHSGLEIINKAQGLTVLADGMLRQLFYNLIDNSLKHGKKVSEIQLSYFKTGIETKLIYEDNGSGIPFENKQKIFSKGFTTGGSGLGLKLVKRMVEAYGWTITEEGEAGKGAKFVITIPK
jgi:PAS domain S-box-containing protein